MPPWCTGCGGLPGATSAKSGGIATWQLLGSVQLSTCAGFTQQNTTCINMSCTEDVWRSSKHMHDECQIEMSWGYLNSCRGCSMSGKTLTCTHCRLPGSPSLHSSLELPGHQWQLLFRDGLIWLRSWWIPGIPTTIKTMGVNITTIDYLRVLIIEIGSKPLF